MLDITADRDVIGQDRSVVLFNTNMLMIDEQTIVSVTWSATCSGVVLLWAMHSNGMHFKLPFNLSVLGHETLDELSFHALLIIAVTEATVTFADIDDLQLHPLTSS